jgi:RHS repeat-associated protein
MKKIIPILFCVISALFLASNALADTPSNEFTFTVQRGAADPLAGVKCYVFNQAGSYLGLSASTDSSGTVSFNLAAGSYRFRVDYLGYQFWSDLYAVPTTLSAEMSIPHQDVVITVQGSVPLPGLKVYLFTAAGSYQGQSRVTDVNGQVSFNLPGQAYKVRVDYLGKQFWSEVFVSHNTTVNVPMAEAEVTVTGAGVPLSAVKVYVFSAAGSYLGISGATDANGKVLFTLAAGEYKFRADYQGSQYWSAEKPLIAGQVNPVTILTLPVTIQVPDVVGLACADAQAAINDAGLSIGTTMQEYSQTIPSGRVISQSPAPGTTLERGFPVDLVVSLGPAPMPSVNITASPQTIHSGESATLSWTSRDTVSCTIEPDIGTVDLSGSLEVTPDATTTYVITASGPGGTATDTIELQVILAFEYECYGTDADEQERSGGLIAETIRILNGNVVESRSDLDFPSPNRLGLRLLASYNSRYENVGSMGHGWTHTYEATLESAFVIDGVTSLRITDGTAKAFYFQERAPGEYSGLFGEHSRVKAEPGGHVWYRLDGSRYTFLSSGRLARVEDAVGNILDLAYDINNRLETVTDVASGRVLAFHYSSDRLDCVTGPVTAAVPDGLWVTYGYDTNQNLTTVTYADGSGFTYAYNDLNDPHNLTRKKDLLNHVLREWSYNSSDQATACLTPDGKGVTSITYTGSQVAVRDAYDVLRTYTLANVGGRKKVTLMIGITNAPYADTNAVRWLYDEKARLLEVEYGGGRIDLYQDYDERGNPGTLISASGSPEQRTIQYTYHPEMDVPLSRSELSVLGGGKKMTIWDYDNDYDTTPNESPTTLLSRIVEQGYSADSNGATVSYEYITTFTYNEKGQVHSVDSPKPGTGDMASFSYNASTGNMESIVQPHIGATLFTDYDAAGRPGIVTDVNGHSKAFTYDGRGRIITITNCFDTPPSSTQLVYVRGLLDSVTDPDGVTQFFDYDTLYGRLSAITDADGNYILHTYETYPRGNLIERGKYDVHNNRAARKRWSYEHPTFPGKLYKEIQADETYWEYNYDASGNLSSAKDPNGNLVAYLFDFMNRAERVTQRVNDPNPRDLITDYGYDVHGNLTTLTDAEGHETSYVYDDMGRVVTTISADTGITRYAYDEVGNLKSKTDAKGIKVEYTYDNLGRVLAVDYPGTTDDITYTYDQGLNAKGHLTGVVDTGGVIVLSYDDVGRVVQKMSTMDGVSYSLAYGYTPAGRVDSITYPSGRIVTYDRNALGKIFEVAASGIPSPLATGLFYRPFGGPLGMINGTGGAVSNQSGECDCITVSNPGQPRERTYGYDPNRNLISITGVTTPWYSQTFAYDELNRLTIATGRYGTISYTYDDAGNRLTRNINGFTETYAYSPGTNRLQQITGGVTPRTFTYDANGNITGDGNLTLTYDQINRLVQVEHGANTIAEYAYNGLGQRVKKTTGEATTVYHYDLDGKLIAESSINGDFTKEYLYMGKVRVVMVDVATDNAIYYYLNDRLGTPEILTDATGTVVWEAWHEPFGQVYIHPSSSVENNPRMPGQYFDQETGLHYNYYRYYDPKTGRYLTPDPIGLLGGVHLFLYAENSPLTFIDELGLWGAGLAAAESTEGGIFILGAGQTASAGIGLFARGLHIPSVGGLATFGGFAGGRYIENVSSPCEDENNWALGGYAGIGVNVFLTNATEASELQGPAKTYSINIGWAQRVLSLQFTISKGGTWVFSYGGPLPHFPVTGYAYGASLSFYSTYTVSTTLLGENRWK